MKRNSNKGKKSNAPTWKKRGGGSLRVKTIKGEAIIKKDQVFQAYAEDIPTAFMNSLLCIDKGSAKKSEKKSFKVVEYTLKPSDDESTRLFLEQSNALNTVTKLDELKAQCEAEEVFEPLTVALSTENEVNLLREKMQELISLQLMYNIVDKNGKVQNADPLSKELATEMLDALK